MTASTRPATRLDPDELAALEEQRDFLLASLDDLEREHDAGDIDEDDYRTLHEDYTARTAEVLHALDERRQAFADARRPSSTGRIAAIVVGVLVFAVVSGVLVAQALGGRAPDQTSSGGIRQTPSQEAKRCITAFTPGQDPLPALKCYQKVLERDPANPVALAYQGWTINLTALTPGFTPEVVKKFRTDAATFVARAVKADPSYSDALAFSAIIAFQRDRPAEAQRALVRLDRSNPPPEITALIKQFDLRKRIAAALRTSRPAG